MNAQVQSNVQTAATLCQQGIALTIPCYQRPYVWPSEDVEVLLEQIILASELDANGQPAQAHYFIGTVLTSEVTSPTSDAFMTYEIIDGQQRMTTLMVLALAFCALMPSSLLRSLVVLGNAPRLTFNIREEVQSRLSAWAGLTADTHSDEKEASNPYLIHLIGARKVACDRLKRLQAKGGDRALERVADYLFNQVTWVNNVMPMGMDLNKLFATLNTSGVQLEQTDILKARLMKCIKQNRATYEGIWQACEDMGNYFEKNLRDVFAGAHWGGLKFNDLTDHSFEHFSLDRPAAGYAKGRTISEIMSMRVTDDATIEALGEKDEARYQSIASFGLLLMHAFRIYRFAQNWRDIGSRLNDSNLNDCFFQFAENATAAQAKGFMECLWNVRFQFDRWVVKWVRLGEEDERTLRLSSINNRSKGNGPDWRSITQETGDLSQLQSMRYLTGERSAQYWLTPFLGRLVNSPGMAEHEVLALLEHIDNQLSLTAMTQKEASYRLLYSDNAEPEPIATKIAYLKEAHGTSFEHYWFQKLEYILWRERRTSNWLDPDKLQLYRITSKNSVEHVHPQNEEFGRTLSDDLLHGFGNLVLLSPGENSSYSNLAVIKKQAAFRTKPKYDSLKLAHMFHVLGKGDDWGQHQINEHAQVMLSLLETHYDA
ncbi:DUF262 domain-containing protein [Pseudomonas salomonii]|uniref:Uncharacterized conserved protein, contains ParB-like and HNH nuclease domains n=1 Tax=Pseudomonas salomonii TaxID=191391 RepID=A0A1H3GSI2_9PSED|nr:DUF262 domain-containing protein [Pseudomonas salomonii]SDY05925.1 Uncharacterized conserved protein, contains ParB-like and HNH nuclease domains [Pseudomonas salomonii]